MLRYQQVQQNWRTSWRPLRFFSSAKIVLRQRWRASQIVGEPHFIYQWHSLLLLSSSQEIPGPKTWRQLTLPRKPNSESCNQWKVSGSPSEFSHCLPRHSVCLRRLSDQQCEMDFRSIWKSFTTMRTFWIFGLNQYILALANLRQQLFSGFLTLCHIHHRHHWQTFPRPVRSRFCCDPRRLLWYINCGRYQSGSGKL